LSSKHREPLESLTHMYIPAITVKALFWSQGVVCFHKCCRRNCVHVMVVVCLESYAVPVSVLEAAAHFERIKTELYVIYILSTLSIPGEDALRHRLSDSCQDMVIHPNSRRSHKYMSTQLIVYVCVLRSLGTWILSALV
jgi:hypothetical protein